MNKCFPVARKLALLGVYVFRAPPYQQPPSTYYESCICGLVNNICRPRLIVEVGRWRAHRIYDGMRYWLAGIPYEWEFSFRSSFRSGNGITLSSKADFLLVRKPDPRSCPTIPFRPAPF